MRKVLRPVLVVVLLGASWGAWAGGTGNELISRCGASVAKMDGRRDVDAYDLGYCMGLVRGVADFVVGEFACPPADSNTGQWTRVVYKYLQEHPTELHERDTTLVLAALNRAWPCPKKP